MTEDATEDRGRPEFLSAELRGHLDKLTEPQVLAVVLFGEARSEPIEGIVAVANVVRNRVAEKRWFGTTYREVCLKPWQFSCLNPLGGQKNYERVLALALHMASGTEVRDPLARQCIGVSLCVAQGYFLDSVKGANHYHTAVLMPRPTWAQDAIPVKQVASHVFYKL